MLEQALPAQLYHKPFISKSTSCSFFISKTKARTGYPARAFLNLEY
jgi:hypothetical protein